MEQKNFWENKKVLITGVNGFVGSNLSENLVQNNANVFGLIRNFEPNTYLFFEKINEKINLINGDITNKELIKTIIVEQNIEIVFHLAAQVEVGIAEKYPYLTWETNIRGTYTLLDAIRESSKNIKSIIVASSDKAYGEYPQELLPYKENYNLKPIFPYDTSKACADMIAQTYAKNSYGLPIIITRFANIYGPGQLNFSAIIPDCIRSALGYSRFVPRTNGTNIRDFLFVDDVIVLYLLVAKSLSENQSLNPKNIVSVKIDDGVFDSKGYKPSSDICTHLELYREYSSMVQSAHCSSTPIMPRYRKGVNRVVSKIQPMTYVSANVPPLYFIHGTQDQKAPVSHLDDFVKALREAGAKDITYKRYDDGTGHGAYVKHIKESRRSREEFLARTLNGERHE